MITRLHGRSSTLAANPRRKTHKRRNPALGRNRLGHFVARHGKSHKRRNPTLSAVRKKVHARLPAGARPAVFLYGQKVTATTRKGKTVKRTAFSGSRELRTYASGKRHMAVKPKFTIFRSGKGKAAGYGIVKNPRRKHAFGHKRRNGGPVVAGLPILELGGGALITIGVNPAIQGYLEKKDPTSGKSLLDQIPGMTNPTVVQYHIPDAVADILVAALAAFAYKKTNGTAKELAKWTFAFSAYGAVDKTIGRTIKEQVATMTQAASAHVVTQSTTPPATGAGAGAGAGGLYMTATGKQAGVGGTYAPVRKRMSGMYVSKNGNMHGDFGLGRVKVWGN